LCDWENVADACSSEEGSPAKSLAGDSGPVIAAAIISKTKSFRIQVLTRNLSMIGLSDAAFQPAFPGFSGRSGIMNKV